MARQRHSAVFDSETARLAQQGTVTKQPVAQDLGNRPTLLRK
jgi:hypothetical protein